MPQHSKAAAITAALAISLSACGAGKPAPKPPSPPQHLADTAVLHAIPLRTPASAVVARIGKPARVEHGVAPLPKAKHAKQRHVAVTDYFYGVKGQPGASADLTFVHGRLASVLIAPAG